MTSPYYGKRNLGVGTAASPGDTLYFHFGTYNDSGNSEADTGFSVTDIDVYKNNATTPRLTDSGYALITDTGTPGLRRFSIQLFNTADDASFYASGGWYQVAVDNVKIDGKLVRLWAGSFEIGEPRANVVQLGGDTGAANQLRAAFANGFNDTGITNRFDRIQSELDTGLRVHIDDSDTGIKDVIADLDTGLRGILVTTGVLVSAFSDTGVNERLARIQSDVDTGLRVHIDDSDTGIKDVIADLDTGLRDFITDAKNELDTGGVNVTAVVDTGVVNQAVWQGNASRTITSFDVDTGLRDLIADKINELDTGLRDTLADYDTGIRDFITDAKNELDTGGVNVTATVDTGVINQAVWQADAVRGITAIADTGMNERFGRIQSDVDTGLRTHIDDSDTGIKDAIADLDTGLRDFITDAKNELDTGGVNVTATVDTGVINQAVWQGNASRTITSFDVDTGLRELIADLDTGIRALLALRDTGAIATAVWAGDTGLRDTLADYDTGVRALFALQDTGKIATAVWAGDTGLRDLISDVKVELDTGLRAILALQDTGAVATAVWAGDTGLRDHIANVDTGLTNRLSIIGFDVDTGLRAQISDVDTGVHAVLAAMLDTGGWVEVNVRKVNRIAIAGAGDTGAANPWRPA